MGASPASVADCGTSLCPTCAARRRHAVVQILPDDLSARFTAQQGSRVAAGRVDPEAQHQRPSDRANAAFSVGVVLASGKSLDREAVCVCAVAGCRTSRPRRCYRRHPGRRHCALLGVPQCIVTLRCAVASASRIRRGNWLGCAATWIRRSKSSGAAVAERLGRGSWLESCSSG